MFLLIQPTYSYHHENKNDLLIHSSTIKSTTNENQQCLSWLSYIYIYIILHRSI